MKKPCVYILTNKPDGVLYIGMTTNLPNRREQHLRTETKSFTAKYKTRLLVFVEMHETIEAAALRERQLKKWKRDWKIRLITEQNPDWQDLTFKLDHF